MTLDIPVHSVASALKRFFFELSEPLITPDLQEDIVAAVTRVNREDKMAAMREAMLKLPRINWKVLSYLMVHLHR